MNYKTELKNALNIALLKKNVMHHVSEDKSKTVFGYYIIIAAAALGMLGQLIFGFRFMGIISKPPIGMALITAAIQVISTVIGIYVLSFVAKSIFKGHAKHDQFFRVAAYGMVVMSISLIPQLSIIGGIWGLVLMFVILKTIHKLTTGGVIGTLIVSFIAMLIISMILTPVYALIGFGSMGGGTFKSGGFMDRGTKSFEINVPGQDGGTVNFGEGGMRIETEDGEVMEINIPNFDYGN